MNQTTPPLPENINITLLFYAFRKIKEYPKAMVLPGLSTCINIIIAVLIAHPIIHHEQERLINNQLPPVFALIEFYVALFAYYYLRNYINLLFNTASQQQLIHRQITQQNLPIKKAILQVLRNAIRLCYYNTLSSGFGVFIRFFNLIFIRFPSVTRHISTYLNSAGYIFCAINMIRNNLSTQKAFSQSIQLSEKKWGTSLRIQYSLATFMIPCVIIMILPITFTIQSAEKWVTFTAIGFSLALYAIYSTVLKTIRDTLTALFYTDITQDPNHTPDNMRNAIQHAFLSHKKKKRHSSSSK